MVIWEHWLSIVTHLHMHYTLIYIRLSFMMQSREISLKSNTWHFQLSIWLKSSFGEVHFAENTTWIGPVVPRLWAIEGFSGQLKTKEIHSFFWLYLTINAPDFRLIPLDRNTYFANTCTTINTVAWYWIWRFLLWYWK